MLAAVGLTISGTGFRLRMGRAEENEGFDVVTSRLAVFGGVATLTTSLTSCISGTSSSGNWLREGTIQSLWIQRNPGDKKGKQCRHRGFTYAGAIKHHRQRWKGEIKKDGKVLSSPQMSHEGWLYYFAVFPSPHLLDFWSLSKCLQITSVDLPGACTAETETETETWDMQNKATLGSLWGFLPIMSMEHWD